HLMVPDPDERGRDRAAEVRRAALVSKVLLNVFATAAGTVTAGQLSRWQSDTGWLERALGCTPGGLRGGQPGGSSARAGASLPGPGGGGAAPARANLPRAIGPNLGASGAAPVTRMRRRGVLAAPDPAAQLPPSRSLIEQLLRDKNTLPGAPLANAKSLIRR